MKDKLSRFTQFPWYPFLFGAFPVLALLVNNLGQVKWIAGVRPLALTIVASIFIVLVLRLALGDIHRASFLTMLWMLLFFSYGHIHLLLQEEKTEPDPDLTLLLAAMWLFLALLAFWWATRPRLRFENSARAL
ncbi:MAG: hypothetical protein FJZ96_10860, partial [Chloroflexi bacterium]|nr:hypothetical protein [Chloroflexota bacterium]